MSHGALLTGAAEGKTRRTVEGHGRSTTSKYLPFSVDGDAATTAFHGTTRIMLSVVGFSVDGVRDVSLGPWNDGPASISLLKMREGVDSSQRHRAPLDDPPVNMTAGDRARGLNRTLRAANQGVPATALVGF